MPRRIGIVSMLDIDKYLVEPASGNRDDRAKPWR